MKVIILMIFFISTIIHGIIKILPGVGINMCGFLDIAVFLGYLFFSLLHSVIYKGIKNTTLLSIMIIVIMSSLFILFAKFHLLFFSSAGISVGGVPVFIILWFIPIIYNAISCSEILFGRKFSLTNRLIDSCFSSGLAAGYLAGVLPIIGGQTNWGTIGYGAYFNTSPYVYLIFFAAFILIIMFYYLLEEKSFSSPYSSFFLRNLPIFFYIWLFLMAFVTAIVKHEFGLAFSISAIMFPLILLCLYFFNFYIKKNSKGVL